MVVSRISPQRSARHPRLIGCALALVLSGAAAAAPSAPGDRSPTALQNLEALNGELTVEAVDSRITDDRLPMSGEKLQGIKVPYLYLTPRVASILENVFGDDGGAASGIVLDETRQGEPAEDSATSPVADLETADAAEAPSLDTGTLPRFQRQMYRTDI